MEIKIGDRWLCIRNVEIWDTLKQEYTGDIVYRKGHIYITEQSGCITNDTGLRSHYWKDTEELYNYFRRIPRNKKTRYENNK